MNFTKFMEELNDMTDESLMLDIDIIEKEHEKALAAKDQALIAKDQALTAKDQTIAAQQDEINRLKKQLEALQGK